MDEIPPGMTRYAIDVPTDYSRTLAILAFLEQQLPFLEDNEIKALMAYMTAKHKADYE